MADPQHIHPDTELIAEDDRVGKHDLQKMAEVQITTAARNVRAAFKAQTQLNKLRLIASRGPDGAPIPRDAHSFKDSIGIQILKAIEDEIEELVALPLGDDETELQRKDRILKARAAQAKMFMDMQAAVARTVDRSARCSQESAKLQFQMKKHRDEMAKGGYDAREVEAIADG